jgi:hypothetical protein
MPVMCFIFPPLQSPLSNLTGRTKLLGLHLICYHLDLLSTFINRPAQAAYESRDATGLNCTGLEVKSLCVSERSLRQVPPATRCVLVRALGEILNDDVFVRLR